MSNKILVAGASGNIGKALVDALKAAHADFAIMSSKPAADGNQGVATVQADYADVESLKRAFMGVDTLFLVFPLVPNKLTLAANAAAAAKAAGVKHIVRSSGAGADPNAAYALPKLQGTIDKLLADTGIACTFLRNAGFMQNYATFLSGMIKGGAFYAATNNARQSLVDVRDIAAVAAKVLLNPATHAGKAYTLTGGESLTDEQRLGLISRVTGKPVSYVPISLEQGDEAMRTQMQMPEPLVQWLGSLNALVSAGYAADISPDVEAILGRKPITFAQFAQDYAASWR